MKSVTEFQSHKLVQGIGLKKNLTESGKTPEDVLQSLGESFKLEGEKLKYFFNALEVAEKNMDKLARVLVVTYSEGEVVPPKTVKVDEHYYLPEFQKPAGLPGVKVSAKPGGKGKGKGDKGQGKKGV